MRMPACAKAQRRGCAPGDAAARSAQTLPCIGRATVRPVRPGVWLRPRTATPLRNRSSNSRHRARPGKRRSESHGSDRSWMRRPPLASCIQSEILPVKGTPRSPAPPRRQHPTLRLGPRRWHPFRRQCRGSSASGCGPDCGGPPGRCGRRPAASRASRARALRAAGEWRCRRVTECRG